MVFLLRFNFGFREAARERKCFEDKCRLLRFHPKNRPLYNRYRHTKKKRIRKKYAKRILEWYRTEVAPC